MSQGKATPAEKIERAKALLLETELTFGEVGNRLGLSGTTVATINRRAGIREFTDTHHKWTTENGHCDIRIHVEGPVRRAVKNPKDGIHSDGLSS